jgi:hypothetical protein
MLIVESARKSLDSHGLFLERRSVMRLNLKLLVSLIVFTMSSPISWATEAVAQGIGRWGGDSGQPVFGAFTSPDFSGDFDATTNGLWSANQQWTEGRTLFEEFLLQNPDGFSSNSTLSDEGGVERTSIFEDWGVGGENALWGFAPLGSALNSGAGELIVPPLW